MIQKGPKYAVLHWISIALSPTADAWKRGNYIIKSIESMIYLNISSKIYYHIYLRSFFI